MISHPLRAIFIHIPKCAGTSVDVAMFGKEVVAWNGRYWLQHATIKQIRDEYATPEEFEKYFKFAFVRNPYDRMFSAFNFLASTRVDVTRENFKDFLLGKGPLAQVIAKKNEHLRASRYHHVVPMHEYLYEDGKCLVDFIGRFENIDEDWKKICEKIGNEELPHSNKIPHVPWQEFYTQELKEIVREQYAKDFELFGYEK